MIQVRCSGCSAVFDLDERRIPKSGQRMRCPKCGTSLLVMPNGEASAAPRGAPGGADLPAPASARGAAAGGTDLPAPAVARPATTSSLDELDLPAPAAPKVAKVGGGGADLPAPARPRAAPAPSAPAAKTAAPTAFDELDLPMPASSVADLPAAAPPRPATSAAATGSRAGGPTATSNKDGADLPAVRSKGTGAADLPARSPRPAAGAGRADVPAAKGAERAGVASADLPAAARARTADLPATAPKPSPRAAVPGADLPAAARGVGVDLPAVSSHAAASPRTAPTAAGKSAAAFGEISLEMDALTPASADEFDLPAPASAKGAPAAKGTAVRLDSLDDLPSAPAAARAEPPVDDLDLPFLPSEDKPSVRPEGSDLPSSLTTTKKLGRVALERRAVPVASIGLPTPASVTAPPAASGSPGLPSPAGVIAPPVPASVMAPPTPADVLAPPLPKNVIAPPTPSSVMGHPAPAEFTAAPVSAERTGLPRAASPEAFGELDLSIGEPVQPPARTPVAAVAEPSELEDFDLPLPPPPEPEPRSRANAGGTAFGEISLGIEEPTPAAEAHAGDEFDEIPLESKPAGTPARAIEIAATPPSRVAPATTTPRAEPRAATTEKRPARTGLYVALGLVAALVIGGAALSLTPMGAFGTTYLDERLHGPARHAGARAAIDAAQSALEADVYGQAHRALERLESQLTQTPAERELVAYDTYAHYMVLSRFGNDSAIAARARTLAERLSNLPDGTQYAAAARAARGYFNGRPDAARRGSTRDPVTRDLVTLALLDGDDAHAAVESARSAASQSHPTARARFLYARALNVSNDRAGAVREAEALIAASARHAGARLLLARILSERSDTRDRAITLAGEVEHLGTDASHDERSEAAVLIGQTELAREHVSLARQAFERALQIDPRSPPALDGLASILYRQGNFTDALARFQAAATADANDVEARLGVAMASLGLSQPGDARSALEPLARAHANDPRVHFWLGKALLAINETTPAEREFRDAIRLDNTNLEAYTTLATMLFSLQRPEAGEQVLQDARAHVSDQAAIHRALGEGRAARGDLAGAESELRLAVEARPEDIRSHFELAQTMRRLQHYDDAARELDAVAHLESEYPGLLLERGTLLETRGDAAGALTTFRAALEHDPNNVELMVRVASAQVATGHYADADAQLAQVAIDHPSIAEAQFVLGRARMGQGNTADAVRLFERATELDATRADFRAWAAQANLSRSQFARAFEQANNAITLDPNYARAYWVRAEIRVRQGQPAQGLVDAQQALRVDPNFAEALVTLADADEALGHSPEAVLLYRRALALRPDEGEWHARLGRVLADQGHNPDAAAELERATALGDPVNPPPSWLAPAHRQLGDLVVSHDRVSARRHYARFLELSPPNAPGVADVRQALSELR